MFSLKILTVDSMKLNQLQLHLETVLLKCVGKTPEFFNRNLNIYDKQKYAFAVTSKPLLSSFTLPIEMPNVKKKKKNSNGESGVSSLLLLMQLKQCLMYHMPKNPGKFHFQVTQNKNLGYFKRPLLSAD
jgi:hypothetical protein